MMCHLIDYGYTKLMILPGWDPSNFWNVQLIDLASEEQNCQQPARFPWRRGFFGTTFNGLPFACNVQDECYYYNKEQDSWDQDIYNVGRHVQPGHVMINNSCFWVTGGEEEDYHQTSEIYTNDGWQEFISIPGNKRGHCNLQINDTHYFLTGGEYEVSAYIVDINNPLDYTTLENTSVPRGYAGCGMVVRSDGSKEIVLAGSGLDSDNSTAQSSEIFSFETMNWRPGPDLPEPLTGMRGVQLENTFLTVGGERRESNYGKIMMYNQRNDSWIIFPQTLTSSSGGFDSAFLVPDEAVNCDS